MSKWKLLEAPTGPFADRYIRKECIGCDTPYWILRAQDQFRKSKYCSAECRALGFKNGTILIRDPVAEPPSAVPVYCLMEGPGNLRLPGYGTLLPPADGKSRLLFYSHFIAPEELRHALPDHG